MKYIIIVLLSLFIVNNAYLQNIKKHKHNIYHKAKRQRSNSKCLLDSSTKYAAPLFCHIQSSQYINLQVNVIVLSKIDWYGAEDWQYWVKDQSGKVTPINRNLCVSSQSEPGKYYIEDKIQLSLKCKISSIPRQLKKGDYIDIQMFKNKVHHQQNLLGFRLLIK